MEGGAPYPLADLDGGPDPQGVQIKPRQRIESFEILPAILGNPRLQGNFDRDMEKKYNSYWYNLNIRTLQETLEMRWRYLLTATAQGKRRGSKRKPN